MIIWRGLGWLIPIIFIAVLVLSQWGLDAALGENYYTQNDWPKMFAISLVVVCIAALGYFLNHKKRVIIVDEATGKSQKEPSHTLFFIPIEYWAIIISVVSVWSHFNSKERDAVDMAYLQTPAVSDKYIFDTNSIYEDSEYAYGLFKVTRVDNGSVEVINSKYSYDSKSLIREELKDGSANDASYYSGGQLVFSVDELIEMKRKGQIYSVHR
jgi:hypothetical protein